MNNETFYAKSTHRGRLLAIFAVAILAIGIGLSIFSAHRAFRITSVNPAVNNVAQISPFFKINFSKPLSDKGISLALGGAGKSYSVSGNTLNITLAALKLNTKYTITVRSVTSIRGEKITNKSFTFKPKDIAYNNLPKDQQQATLDRQDQYPADSPLRDPIVAKLPYNSIDFDLSTQIVTDSTGKQSLALNAVLSLSQADLSNPAAATSQYKQEVIEYIQSLGLDPSKYTINYSIAQ